MKSIIFSLLLVLSPVLLYAQTTREEVLSVLGRTGGVYYAYPVTESANTPAPKGYEPVYVSHYGRHGSRYLISDNDYIWVYDLLVQARNSDALTTVGIELLSQLDKLMAEVRGRGGDLTPLGVRQHKAIASRMAKAYPEIFKAKNAVLTARSTLVPRCILSMAAFCESLKEQNPELVIDREASNRYMPYLCYHSPNHGEYTIDGKWKEQYRKFKSAHTNSGRLVSAIFSYPAFVDIYVNPADFMWGLYWIASDMQNTETGTSLYYLFTEEELFDLWQCFNYVFYVNDGAFGGNATMMIDNAHPLIANIIESADIALASGKPCADLRFGHDGNLIPLAAAMHLKDCDLVTSDPNEFYRYFSDWKIAPMAGNIQLIFFRNKKNPSDILVKFMLNERETSIPVDTDIFPFYRWEDARGFLLKEISEE